MIVKDSISLSKKTLVRSEFGIHARPAAKIAQMAQTAHADIWLNKDGLRADAADVLEILSLNAVKGTQIVIEIENQNDMEILTLIVEFFENSFRETV